MSLPRGTSGTSGDACWVCHQRLDKLGDVERVTDPRTGEWAHKTCCDKSTAGAVWRLQLSLRKLREVLLVNAQNDAERVGHRLLPLVPRRVRKWIGGRG